MPLAAPRDLADLSLEELMNETITSVSSRTQKLDDVAAAVAVISNEDIRRSGATTLPEALRTVPGLNVSAVNPREWSISARGFGGVFSNKQLVLVDGRTVYSPLFAGVYWALQQNMLEDLDRIEVIRGPGATVWGANAVNGVINVVSRTAKETQGGLLSVEAGDVELFSAYMRYGGKIGENTYFRVYGGHQSHGDWQLGAGGSAEDGWDGQHGGFRLGHYFDPESLLTWQADITTVNFSESSRSSNFNTLGRWSRSWSERESVQLQAYYDHTSHDDAARTSHVADTFDVSAQRVFGIGERHDFVAGTGYRFNRNELRQTNALLKVRNGDFDAKLVNAFVQDEFKLVPEVLLLTAGAKLEHNDYTGFELQPSVRAVWKPAATQTVWGAISRAVRTPDGLEASDVFELTAGLPLTGPDGGLYLPTLVGNGSPAAEVLWAFETGYRFQPAAHVRVDFTVFYNDYQKLITVGGVNRFIAGVPYGIAEVPFQNLYRGHASGGEVQVTMTPTEKWRLVAAYSLIDLEFEGPTDATLAKGLVPPRHQISLRSAYDFSRRLSIDLQLRYLDHTDDVPAYGTADLHLAYRFTPEIEFSVTGQNLLDPSHPEQGTMLFVVPSEVPRFVKAKITVRF